MVVTMAGVLVSASLVPGATIVNPLTQPWSGPYGGVPPFAAVKVEQIGRAHV